MKVELNVKQPPSISVVIIRLALLGFLAFGFAYAILQVCSALFKAIK